MEFKRVGLKSYSLCGVYRTFELKPGLFIAERVYYVSERPQHLYAPWCFVAFARSERQARNNCRLHASAKPMTDAKKILQELGIPCS